MNKFRLNYQKGIIFCRGKVLNKKASVILKMALDTGATYTMMPNEILLSIGLNSSRATRTIEVTTGSGIILVPILVVPRFRALGYEIKNLEVVCHNLPPESAVEGLLGLNFLKHFNICLKFPESILEIAK